MNQSIPPPLPGSSTPPPLPGSNMPFKLTQLNGGSAGRVYEIKTNAGPDGSQRAIIGRSTPGKMVHVSIEEPVVSRKHAELVFDGEVLCLNHLSESNPTFINNRELSFGEKGYLKINDIITLADIQLKVSL